MIVELVEEYRPELKTAFDRLIPQLSTSTPPVPEATIKEIIDQKQTYLFVYRSQADGPILGMLTLATFDIPTGKRAWIEDVVVDAQTRGQGAGQLLVEAAVEYAQRLGAKSVDLTSRPSREAANRLYRRCGFEARETNVYRFAKKA